MKRPLALLFLLVIPGAVGAIIFAWFAVVDYMILIDAYTRFAQVASGGGSMQALFAAESAQNIHRVNLFAEGVWALLSAIYMAIGIHGMSVARNVGNESSRG